MAKKAYIGVPSYTVIIENTMTYSSDGEWSWGLNTSNEVNWTKGNTYVCNVEIDGVVYPNLTFAPDVGASWFATYSENGEEVFGVYVSANNQLYDYKLGLDTAVSHSIRLSSGSLDGVARKIKKGYIGVADKARKIKKAYIGIGGIARPCWSGGEPTYYGTITTLSNARSGHTGGTIGDYALFYAGIYNFYDDYYYYTDVYNKDLVRQNKITGPDIKCSDASAGNTQDYVIFYCGSRNDATWELPVTAYSATLTRKSLTRYTNGYDNHSHGCATVGGYAVFGGGFVGGFNQGATTVTTYNNSLTKGSATAFAQKRGGLGGATIGGYAVFVGGSDYVEWDTDDYRSVPITLAEAYNSNLTKSTITSLSTARDHINSAIAGKYALFGGGYTNNYTESNVVEAYDENLTRTKITALSVKARSWATTSLGTNALFACPGDGTSGSPSKVVNIYDENLTRTIGTSLSVARQRVAATTIGDSALFAGGTYHSTSNGWQDVGAVDVYKLV